MMDLRSLVVCTVARLVFVRSLASVLFVGLRYAGGFFLNHAMTEHRA